MARAGRGIFTVTITGLTYTELLATIPWVTLMPAAHHHPCRWGSTVYGRGKHCKSSARLMYFNLDGTAQAFCHHHLYAAKMAQGYSEPGESGHEERVRNQAWLERVTTNRGVVRLS
jgi:hypothetical protein